jgi:hypothetical protein
MIPLMYLFVLALLRCLYCFKSSLLCMIYLFTIGFVLFMLSKIISICMIHGMSLTEIICFLLMHCNLFGQHSLLSMILVVLVDLTC